MHDSTYDDGAYEEEQGPYWHDQLDKAAKVFDKWEKRGKKVVRRYRDERDAIEMPRMKFNILWSNISVLFPALYGRMAKPEVSRRYSDQDPVGRLASTMLERVIEYEVTQFSDFDSAMQGVVQDRLLPGRGTAMSGTITPAIGFHRFPANVGTSLYATIAGTALNVTFFYAG